MAAFVKSVESVQTTFTASGTNTVNLSKSQDETQCWPIHTLRFTADHANGPVSGCAVRCVMIDNAGTPAVEVHWTPGTQSPVGQILVEIYVVEFGSNITVQSGTVSLTGTSVTDTITSVTQGNSFIAFSQDATTANDAQNWNDFFVQARFNSNTEVQFERRASGLPDFDITYYVIESDGTDFTTQYIEDTMGSSEQGPTNITISSVDISKSFIVGTYESAEPQAHLRHADANLALTSSTALTEYRNHGVTVDQEITFGVWVVECPGSEFSVQRFATNVNGQLTTTQAITTIDQDKSVIISSQNIGSGCWPITSATGGTTVTDYMHTLVFSADNEVTLQRRNNTTIFGSNTNIRYEVVEFELESAGTNEDIVQNTVSIGIKYRMVV